MKTLIARLAPGLLVAAVCLVLPFAFTAKAQQPAAAQRSGPVPLPAAESAAPVAYGAEYAQPYGQPAAAPQSITVCGSCGEHIQRPAVVMVAAPVYGRARASGSFYGIPPVGYYAPARAVGYYEYDYCETPRPANVYGLTDGFRARVRPWHVDPHCAPAPRHSHGRGRY